MGIKKEGLMIYKIFDPEISGKHAVVFGKRYTYAGTLKLAHPFFKLHHDIGDANEGMVDISPPHITHVAITSSQINIGDLATKGNSLGLGIRGKVVEIVLGRHIVTGEVLSASPFITLRGTKLDSFYFVNPNSIESMKIIEEEE